MDADGTNIHQISFNQSHDLDPAVLADGRIVFTRWEHEIDDNQFDLYSVNPDGTDLQLLYGANSHATGTVDPPTTEPSIIQFLSPRPMQDGRTLALVRPFDRHRRRRRPGADRYAELTSTTPRRVTANIGMPGPAQMRALPTDVRTIEGPSPGGRYRAAAPLFDGSGRLLVSWSQCRLLERHAHRAVHAAIACDNPDAVEAPPLYGIYIYDVPRKHAAAHRRAAGRLHLHRSRRGLAARAAAGHPRPRRRRRLPGGSARPKASASCTSAASTTSTASTRRPAASRAVRDPANAAYATRPARFLRIEKAVSHPDDDTRDIDNTAFGPNRALGMRDILGYAPIEPDGSVKVKVPANVAFNISVLDASGRRLGGVLGSRHTNWLQLMPGEQLTCNGCHNGDRHHADARTVAMA